MPFTSLSSTDDPRLAVFHALMHSTARGNSRFITEGWWLAERLWASPCRVESMLIAPSQVVRIPRDWVDSIPIYVVAKEHLRAISGYRFHRGILACGIRPAAAQRQDLLCHAMEATGTEPITVVACPQVRDPENLGSILRNGLAFGAQAFWLGTACPDVFSRRVLRVSMGTALTAPVRIADNLLDDLCWLRDAAGFAIVATTLDAMASPLSEMDFPPRCVVLLGREDVGLTDEELSICTHRVTIPMRCGVDSLNISVAAAIVLYEMHGRRALL